VNLGVDSFFSKLGLDWDKLGELSTNSQVRVQMNHTWIISFK